MQIIIMLIVPKRLREKNLGFRSGKHPNPKQYGFVF